jgi:hypothetical protein
MSEKKYELVFEHPSGLILTILTDDIYGVSEQPWFRQFFEDAQLVVPPELEQQQVEEQYVQQPEPVQQPLPLRQMPQMSQQRPAQQQDPYGASVNPAMQRQQPIQRAPVEMPRPRSFLDISEEGMNLDIWNQLNPAQREEWQRKWLK